MSLEQFMEIMRLVVTGPVGAGKSTFIRSVSEIEVVDTDRQATDETSVLKPKTTVAFDFGRLQFGPDMAVHLYGTPGQARFDFMWDILIRQAHAYVLLVAAHRPKEFRYARRIASFMNQRRHVPMIIGLTHTDCPDAWQLENIAIAVGFIDPQNRPPLVIVNANEQASVAQAIITLIQHSMQLTQV
jgi:uncharacterized protein